MRQRLHDRFDHWVQRVEDHMKEPNPTLEELTRAVFALRQGLTQAVTEDLVEQASHMLLGPLPHAFGPAGHVVMGIEGHV